MRFIMENEPNEKDIPNKGYIVSFTVHGGVIEEEDSADAANFVCFQGLSRAYPIQLEAENWALSTAAEISRC